jgi:hypothetical protein
MICLIQYLKSLSQYVLSKLSFLSMKPQCFLNSIRFLDRVRSLLHRNLGSLHISNRLASLSLNVLFQVLHFIFKDYIIVVFLFDKFKLY